MYHAAKLVWNSSNWEYPLGEAKLGVRVNDYFYGLEEWINDKTLRNNCIGYLDCYRSKRIFGTTNIILISYNPIDNNVYHVGNIFGVEQISDTSISQIKNSLTSNWIDSKIVNDFKRIENVQRPHGASVYRSNNWNTNHIIETAPRGFMVNIKYKSIEIFNKEKQISLTVMDNSINKKWRRLTQRFILANSDFNQQLTKYLLSIC